MSLQNLKRVVPQPLELCVPVGSPEHANVPKDKPPFLKRVLSALYKVQKYSAYGFLGFFGLHISSTVVAPALGLRFSTCQDLFEMTRAVYLSPLFEYPLVLGTAAAHVLSGVAMRVLRGMVSKKILKPRAERDIIISDEYRDDIGLGGIGTMLGLGFKKSWISSHFPTLTPSTFSGYVMLLALGFHYYKMRLAPAWVDGDSSLVNLNYVTHYLHTSFYGTAGTLLNYMMLLLLLWVSFYHIVGGLFKYRRQFSIRSRKIAYSVIGLLTSFALIAVMRLKLCKLEPGFIGKQFTKYLMLSG